MSGSILVETDFFEEIIKCLHDKDKNINKDHIKKIWKTASDILEKHKNIKSPWDRKNLVFSDEEVQEPPDDDVFTMF